MCLFFNTKGMKLIFRLSLIETGLNFNDAFFACVCATVCVRVCVCVCVCAGQA